MLKVYWFRVYYGTRAHVNVQIAASLQAAYDAEYRAWVRCPVEHNRKYPASKPQPVASRIVAVPGLNDAQLRKIDPAFANYLDEAVRVLEN